MHPMMRHDAVDEAVGLLMKRRDEALAEVQRIERALADLGRPVADQATEAPPTVMRPEVIDAHPRGTQHLSVRGRLVALLDEEDRDWTVGEVIAEYERRGVPFTVKAPDNALRAALVEAQRKGQVERTTPGRYKSTKFEPGEAGRQWRGEEMLR